ncbi:MAG TPA: metallophosphoesterase [Candidatus Paceibacterota bacterium]|nr:metallophosphoesterase [Candidatus Paceibacterota bacterium]
MAIESLKPKRFSRRKFLLTSFLAAGGVVADARLLEPGWLKTWRIRLCDGTPTHRFVHFTDVHFKGDRDLILELVRQINALSPDFVCFTGDLIEEMKFLAPALELMAGIKSPVYAIPGNHDYWSQASFVKFANGFAKTGGAWLMDESLVVAGGKINLIGLSCSSHGVSSPPPVRADARNILLMHFPAWVKRLKAEKYDLLLAGHSHGGQVRIPFVGPLVLPYFVDEYDLGMFKTGAGPLYVNPGIGWFPVPVRFNCRPEITVFEV